MLPPRLGCADLGASYRVMNTFASATSAQVDMKAWEEGAVVSLVFAGSGQRPPPYAVWGAPRWLLTLHAPPDMDGQLP